MKKIFNLLFAFFITSIISANLTVYGNELDDINAYEGNLHIVGMLDTQT